LDYFLNLGNAISFVFRSTFWAHKCEGKCNSYLFILHISSVISKVKCFRAKRVEQWTVTATSHTFFQMKSRRCSHSLDSGFVCWSCTCIKKTSINGFEKEQNHGGQRRDCFSLFYVGNSQIYWFYAVFQILVCVCFFLLNIFAPHTLKLSSLLRLKL